MTTVPRAANASDGGMARATDLSCVLPLASMYATVMRPDSWSTPEAANIEWARRACPWEEARHSGYFNNINNRTSNANNALEHAARHACPKLFSSRDFGTSRDLHGQRMYFMGDSLMRQWTQSFLCRMRLTHRVIADNMTWTEPPNHQFGRCTNFAGAVLPARRHCQMGDGCVHFEHDVVVCYGLSNRCAPRLISDSPFWEWVSSKLHTYGAGKRTAVILTHGMHMQGASKHTSCTRKHWLNVDRNTSQLALDMLAAGSREHFKGSHKGTKVPKSKFLLVYKEIDATHFPTARGVYNGSASLQERSAWKCRPVRPDDPLPPMRTVELTWALPSIRDLAVPRFILETHEADKREASLLHASHAKVPGKSQPVDCLHWLLPGVPDIWTDKLLAALSSVASNVTSALPTCVGRSTKRREHRWWCPPNADEKKGRKVELRSFTQARQLANSSRNSSSSWQAHLLAKATKTYLYGTG